MMNTRKLLICFAALILATAFSTSVFAQARASLRGVISDEFGAAIVGATVTLTDASGVAKTATTNADGAYAFSGLAPGKYKIHAISTGFAVSTDADVDVAAGRRDPVNISLKIAGIESQVKVNAETPLSTDSSNNANQTVISGRDLDALPDDPDELAAALQALAGPSIGPNGGQIFIDGFSGGNMPPKESIREIRINQNPFSAENDQPSARIEILTKPGSDKMRGSVNLNFTDESLNSRNPFAISSSKRTPFQQRQFGGNLSGPLKKGKASFFLEGNRNDTDDNEIVRATILDPSFNFVQIGQGVVVPRRFTNFSPRLDYAINAKNTLVSRYSYNHNVTRNNGVNGFSLPERGYNNANTSQSFQVTETAVLNATTVNETRFQFNHNHSESFADNTKPVLNVSGAFIGGGSQGGHSISTRNNWELSNFTQIQKGTHTIKFGGRVRGVSITDITPNNFGGQWTFNGGVTGLTSIQRYQRTLQLMQAGMTPTQIRAAGGGAATFSIFAGNPLATVSQFDVEPYIQDDWRYKPNLTISYGLRYEIQDNANSKLDFAPRVAVAWSPGAANSTKPPKTVLRFGGGVFYNRFSEGNTLVTHHNNGTNITQFVFTESTNPAIPTDATTLAVLNQYRCANGSVTPDCIGLIPSYPTTGGVTQTIYKVEPNLKIPTVYVLGGQVERQLPHSFTVSVGAYTVRVQHVLRTRDINAPLPPNYTTRPDPTRGEIYQYEASGKMHQEQMFVGFSSRLNPQFSLSGSYVLSKTTSDSEGPGSFPMNSYDLASEFGRGSGDVRHRFNLFGTYNSKLWKLVFAPLITVNSAPPFNIITGLDSNQDRLANERPTFAVLSAYCSQFATRCAGVVPAFSNTSNDFIPRNFGIGHSQFTAALRITRTFGFGETARSAAANRARENTTADAKRGAGSPGARGPMISTGGAGGGGGERGGGGGMPGMMGGGAGASDKKYTLTVSLQMLNILNKVNLGTPVGSLSSSIFGQSQGLVGSFGGFGGGGGGSPNAGNRKIYLNLRLNF
jgi:hypothetical protein